MPFGSSTAERAEETGVSERTVQRRIERFGAEGMEGLLAAEAAHKRRLQPNIRRLIVATRRVYAVLGSVDIFFYSLRSSSSGVGFWKKAIQGFIASSEIMKLSCEGREFLSSSRLNSSSSGTSR